MCSPRDEAGSTTVEFVLVVPLLALAMLFLIGLGYTLMTKQNAIVGARGVVFYRASLNEDPDLNDLAELAKYSVSRDREVWEVNDLGDSLGFRSDLERIGSPNPDLGAFDLIQGLIKGFYDKVNHEISYEVSTAPTLGLLPRLLRFDNSVRARSTYYLPQGTWTCGQSRGSSYVTIATSSLGIPDWAKRFFDPGCCETYEATR
jgi:Flp pilus assembly pilin Flp